MSKTFFKASNLSLGYSNQIVLKDLKFELKHDQNYQIVGKNGAGKSTLLNYISFNFDGTDFNSKVTRKDVLINQISSTKTLLSDLTLLENINYFSTNSDLTEENKVKVLQKYLPSNYLNEKIKNFSNGMIRRAELSIIEIKNPIVFCIDEPLNFLDYEGVKLFEELIRYRSINQNCNILSSQEYIDIDDFNYEVINLDEY